MNQRWFGTRFPKTWCVTIATASFRRAFVMNKLSEPHMDIFYFHHVCCAANIPLSVKSCVEFNPLFVNNHSLTSQGSPASQHKHRWPTAQPIHRRTKHHTKTCLLTFLSSLCFHLNTVTMTFISTGGRNGRHLTVCAPACDWVEDGTWRRRDKHKNIF